MAPLTRHSVVNGERVLHALAAAPTDGPALIFHLGTPMPPVEWPSLEALAAARSLRLILYARPGYSGSTRHPGRSVSDAATDTTAVLDALGEGEFVTVGHSGGGPHALACAALLGTRCRAAITLAGAAPFDADGIDWMAGMADENVEEFSRALQGVSVLGSYLQAEAERFAGVSRADVVAAFGGLVSEMDREAMTGELADVFADALRVTAAGGVEGWVDDDMAFIKRWGFRLSRIEVPVAVWQGRQDRMVPFTHGRWLADRIPGASSRLSQDEGHVTLLTARLGDVLDDLVDLAAR